MRPLLSVPGKAGGQAVAGSVVLSSATLQRQELRKMTLRCLSARLLSIKRSGPPATVFKNMSITVRFKS
jgi:hypothetical protein